MLPRSRLLIVAVLGALLDGCSCSDDGGGGPCTSASECPTGFSCLDRLCVRAPDGARPEGGTPDANVLDGEAPDATSCATSAQCREGVCRDGRCCAAASACGERCCDGAGEVCFANACVVPGQECAGDEDCGAGRYCEPALRGGGDLPPPDAGPGCAPSLTRPGRCLALPARCPDVPDGGVAPDAGPCVSACEFRPMTGQLDAVTAWSWGQPTPPAEYPEHIDVWSTPVVGRVADGNCDGVVDERDPPNVIFVSSRAIDDQTGLGTCCQCTKPRTRTNAMGEQESYQEAPTACQTGVLRVLDGRDGRTLWSRATPFMGSVGFSGASLALGDMDFDGDADIVALSGEGRVVIVDGAGNTLRTSVEPVIIGAGPPPVTGDAGAFGWGGGLALADLDGAEAGGRRAIEIVYGANVFRDTGTSVELVFRGAESQGGAIHTVTSTLADVDEDGDLEVIAGNTAYRHDGTVLWNTTATSSPNRTLRDGSPGVGDFDGDGHAEVVIVGTARFASAGAPAEIERTITILDGRTGAIVAGPIQPENRVTLPMGQSIGSGGPPTIADFDGDGRPEVGVAYAYFYMVFEVDLPGQRIPLLWAQQNHDLSSSVTGSTVFDFEGDGVAEVLYADECYVWVYDGPTGRVRFAGLTTSFTGTEATVVADADADGHAEMIVVSNGAHPGDPMTPGWRCNVAPWNEPDPMLGRPAWVPPTGAVAYRGVRMFRDAARSWVGTRPVWSQHTYHVTNFCVPDDDACDPAATYGTIPARERRNWTVPWLNNFRENIGQEGIFRAPDATLTLAIRCTSPLELVATVRNAGEALLPPGVTVAFYVIEPGGAEREVGRATTVGSIYPNQGEVVVALAPADATPETRFVARVVVDPMRPTFRQCRDGNDGSNEVTATCLQ